MGNNYIPLLLAMALAAGSFEAYTHQDDVPEDFYPTTKIVEVDRPYITGMAGTGKSTTLKRYIVESLKRVDVTAPTGVAALNVGGMTIHRFCGMLLGPQAGQSNEDYFEVLRRDPRRSVLAGFNRVRRCELLVIDEISMLPGRQLEFVEFLFRRLRGQDEPFGGCQVIATGDFLQLPPVRTSDDEPYDWAFLSPAWQ